jgi:choline monooxygenase
VPPTTPQPFRPTLPVGRPQERSLGFDAYGDAAVYAEERARLFHPAVGPLFVGHRALLDGPGHAAAEADDRVLLTCDEDGTVRALANVCTHAMRPLVAARERVRQSCVTCPYHLWSFRRDGSLIGGPAIALDEAQRDRLALTAFPLQQWRGSLFCGEGAADPAFRADLGRVEAAFEALGRADWLDFGDWCLVHTEDEAYDGDWKSFMEVYGDCYHVPPFHAGLASFADCDTLDWTFGETFHLQALRLNAERGGRSTAYAAWCDGLDRYHELRGETVPELAVVWAAFYPNVMIEYYNGLRVISVLVPSGPDRYVNRVRYFVPPDMERLVPGLPATVLAAYGETAVQDRALNESRHAGLAMAAELGLDAATYLPNLSGPQPELGTVHFHTWWRHRMGR